MSLLNKRTNLFSVAQKELEDSLVPQEIQEAPIVPLKESMALENNREEEFYEAEFKDESSSYFNTRGHSTSGGSRYI